METNNKISRLQDSINKAPCNLQNVVAFYIYNYIYIYYIREGERINP